MTRNESLWDKSPQGRNVVYITSVAFTQRAKRLSEKVRRTWAEVSKARRETIVWREEGKLTESAFRTSDVLLFFCASGIAVRAAAPFLQDKASDPAVLVVGEDGKFVISLVSGHLGGANRYARFIAELLGAQPVITTATDGRNMEALDVWAQKYRLSISDMKLEKRMTSYLLKRSDMSSKKSEEKQRIDKTASDAEAVRYRFHAAGGKENKTDDLPGSEAPYRVCIAEKKQWEGVRASTPSGEEILFLEPKKYVVGIGCRKGTEYRKMEAFVRELLSENDIDENLVSRVCSIDVKKEEACIKRIARTWKAEFTVFSKDDLLSAIGDFSSSDFVKETVGVDNVCERSALLGALADAQYLRERSVRNGRFSTAFFEVSGNGVQADEDACGDIGMSGNRMREARSGTRAELIVKKTVRQGMTAAAAVRLTCQEPVIFTIEEWNNAVQQEAKAD